MFGNLKKSSQLIQIQLSWKMNESNTQNDWDKLSDDSWNYAERSNFPLNYKKKIFDTIKNTMKIFIMCVNESICISFQTV